jgi:hypothetical protein
MSRRMNKHLEPVIKAVSTLRLAGRKDSKRPHQLVFVGMLIDLFDADAQLGCELTYS